MRSVCVLSLMASLALGACGDGGNPALVDDNNDPNNVPNNDPNNVPNNDPNNGLPFSCGEGSVVLGAEGGLLELTEADQADLAGFQLDIGADVAPAGTEVKVTCLDEDIVPEGFVALSPAISVEGPAGVRGGLMKAVLPFRSGKVPESATASSLRIFVRFPTGDVRAPAFVDIQEDLGAGRVAFDSHIFGVYQIGMSVDAGKPVTRRHTFRAITGVSMGAGASAMIGFNHPNEFDIIGALGGASDWTYLVHYIREGGMGGFCPGADPGDPDTWKCDTFSPDQEFEHGMEYDDWFFSTGEGTGGDFDRDSYQEIFQDLTFAFGNMGYYNPDNPYTPPGVPLEEIDAPYIDVCPTGGTIIETGYFDDEYNPDGTLPVISFCDGTNNNDNTLEFDRYCDINPEDGVPDEPNKGHYIGGEQQNIPMQIALAVDYNGNGLRDRGEPVIRNFWEPYGDVGSDGKADEEEAGFDPVINPDPAGDNYHWSYNPFGEEGNWRYDEGEPFEDIGLDGVEGTPQVGDGGYDFGEGNGTHDTNPNLENLFESNARDALVALSDADRQKAIGDTTLYADGGIRDLFNFAVATNQLAGAVHAHGGDVRVYDDFTELTQTSRYEEIDVTQIDYKGLGDHVMVRYGDPDADQEKICLGDGKHVGEIFQTINRLLIMLGFIVNRLPTGDKLDILQPPYASVSGTYWMDSEGLGGKFKYSIALPPGYESSQCSDGADNDGDGLADGLDPDCVNGDHNNEGGPVALTRCSDGLNNDNDIDGLIDMEDPECDSPEDDSESEFFEGSEGFPVIYVLHGYGQAPEDLRPSLLFLSGYMAGGFWPKAILVFPDGFCGETEVTQCSDGIDNDGDGEIDRRDSDCEGSNSESGVDLPACSDGVDNDRDGLVDVGPQGDRGCSSAQDNDEANCRQGTFYADHAMYPDGSTPGPPYERAMLELVEHIDASYRTLPPVEVEVIP